MFRPPGPTPGEISPGSPRTSSPPTTRQSPFPALRIEIFLAVFVVYFFLAGSLAIHAGGVPSRIPPSSPSLSRSEANSANRSGALKAFSKLPLSFEANQGQTDERVKFLSRGAGYNLFLTESEAVFTLRENSRARNRDSQFKNATTAPNAPSPRSAVVRLQWLGAKTPSAIEGEEFLPGRTNYYTGNDPARWRQGVSHYQKVHYRETYPGIDLVYHGTQEQLEYDFVVAPGADPKKIHFALSGAREIVLDGNGDLLIHTDAGVLRQKKPLAYQESDGARREVEVQFILRPSEREQQRLSFAVSAYDRTQPLVIDPVLVYSTFLGGSLREFGNAVAVDGAGFIYVAGQTLSVDFPGASNPPAGLNAFVAKLMPAGNGAADLIYATYLGGSTPINPIFDPADSAEGIAVDQAGNTFITGHTFSSDFPTTAGVFQTQATSTASVAAFVTRLDSNGALSYSTYLGGTDRDFGEALALDTAGNVIVTGTTLGSDFPTTAGALREAVPGQGGDDAFISKLRLNGQGASDLVYSTLLGGTGAESGLGVHVDSANNIYAVGETLSSDFPTTPGAIQSTPGSPRDAFFAKINPAGQGMSDLLYGTYLGGATDDDSATAVAVDSQGRAYLTGQARAGFPTTPNAFRQTPQGLSDVIFAVIDPSIAGVAGLLYSTYIGGTGVDEGTGIALDSTGLVWVTGETESTNFPTDSGPAGRGAFVAVFNPALAGNASLVSSMLLGPGRGNGIATGLGATINPPGQVAVVGTTSDSAFPTTPGAFQQTIMGRDVFIAVLSQQGPAGTALQLLSSANPSFVGQTVTFTAALTSANQQVPTGMVRF